jgi:hypothetical protein
MAPITSIYIPFVHHNCDENKIKHVFMMLLIGEVERVDFVQKFGANGNYNMAFVHLKNWFQNTASVNLREKIERGEEGRIVYDEPYYWAIYKNRNPVNPQNTEEKLECAFMMIEDLQNRVIELEKFNIPPPPRLVRQMATDAGNFISSDEPFPSIIDGY